MKLPLYVLMATVATEQIFVSAHARWKCPVPRSEDTGIKSGPCGDETNNFDFGDIIEVKPGPLRVTFEESVHHTGAPFRISLSGDGSDDESCVLLDHIPHNDDAHPRPRLYEPSTYTAYAVTIDIPDVYCERCSLHLANPMTDKIGDRGGPDGIGCTDPDGTCFSVYHSCTRPIRVTGSVPRSEYQCPPVGGSLSDWPKEWTGDDGRAVDASVPGTYRRESAAWDYTLTDAPMRYRQDDDGMCGAADESIESLMDEVTSGADTFTVTELHALSCVVTLFYLCWF